MRQTTPCETTPRYVGRWLMTRAAVSVSRTRYGALPHPFFLHFRQPSLLVVWRAYSYKTSTGRAARYRSRFSTSTTYPPSGFSVRMTGMERPQPKQCTSWRWLVRLLRRLLSYSLPLFFFAARCSMVSVTRGHGWCCCCWSRSSCRRVPRSAIWCGPWVITNSARSSYP